MDTFMDKISQKLNAQEVIKANSQAETEEMNRLRAELKEYKNAFLELKKLAEESKDRLDSANAENAADVKEMKDFLEEKIALIEEKLGTRGEGEGMVALRNFISEKSTEVSGEIHKECVKVYRNVQGALQEENGRQTDAIKEAIAPLKGKLTAAIVLAALALTASLGGVAFQLLQYFKVI